MKGETDAALILSVALILLCANKGRLTTITFYTYGTAIYLNNMSHIHLTTFIKAPVKRVFDLSRSINLHKLSTADTNEKAIAGVTNGLINNGETVTWQAKHFFKTRQFTSKITAMTAPDLFTDQMLHGDFKSFVHQHHFKETNNGTIMIDILDFESPYGIIGKAVNKLYLKKYLETLLIKRNRIIKQYAETEKWKAILN